MNNERNMAEDCRKETAGIIVDMALVQSQLKTFEKTLETKTAVNVIKERLDTFSDLEHIDQLKNYLLPKIEKFSKMINEFHEDNGDCRECVRNFDKSLSTKANKADFQLLKVQFEANYIPMKNWQKLQEQVDHYRWELAEEAKKLDVKFNDFKQFEIEHNDVKCESLMKTKLK